MTDDSIYVQDQLFATLDPTTRAFYLPNGTKALLTDTVGFIRDLPSQLITAFKATLDELQYADLLLHVIDISNPNFENQLEAVESILRQLKLEEKPRIYVFNKIDRMESLPPITNRLERESCVYISAAGGQNLDQLLALMEQKLVQNVSYRVALPMDKAGLVNQAYAAGQVSDLEYTDTAVLFVWYGRQESWPNALTSYVQVD